MNRVQLNLLADAGIGTITRGFIDAAVVVIVACQMVPTGSARPRACRILAWYVMILGGWAPAAAAQDEPIRYTLLPSASILQVHTYKGGLLGALGHDHDVRAHAFAGTVLYDPQNPSASHVELTIRTDSLFVVIASDSSDIPEITEAMREEVLQIERFPEITFESTEVQIRGDTVHLRGDLTMVGQTRPVEMDLELEVSPERLRVRGGFMVKQTDFDIEPYSTALGTVRVKDEIAFVLNVFAVAER